MGVEERGGVDDEDWLFTTSVDKVVDGKKVKVLTAQQLTRRGVARVTRRLGQAIGTAEPLNPHELRHAFITLGLDAGGTLRDLQRRPPTPTPARPRTTTVGARRHPPVVSRRAVPRMTMRWGTTHEGAPSNA